MLGAGPGSAPVWEAMDNSPWVRLAIIAATLAALTYVARSLWSLAAFAFDIIIVIFLAWVVASAMRRLVKVIRGLLLPRLSWMAALLAYLVVILFAVLLVALVVPLTISQSLSLSQDLPAYMERVSRMVEQIQAFGRRLGLISEIPGMQEEEALQGIGKALSRWLSDNALGIVQGATTIVLQALLILVMSVYMVVDGDRLLAIFYRFLPSRYHTQARSILGHLDYTFYSYLRGIFLIVVIYSLAIGSIMWTAGLPFALPLGLAAGVVQLVPIVGEVAALGIPIAVAFLTQSLTTAIAVTASLLLFSLLMNNFISPRIHGHTLRMPGLFVILGVILGTRIAGVWGAMLGVPMVAFLYSLALAWAERGTLDGLASPARSGPPPPSTSRANERSEP